MVLGAIISCSCFDIKGMEFTCIATWLPYKTECLSIIDMSIIANIVAHNYIILLAINTITIPENTSIL